MKRSIGLLVLTLVLGTGCGKHGGGGSSAKSCGSKDFFSTWSTPSGSVTYFFQGLHFGDNTFVIAYSTGASCTMSVGIQGGQCSGTLDITNSTWNNDGPSDPGCSAHDGHDTYTKSVDGLYGCDQNNSCVLFQ